MYCYCFTVLLTTLPTKNGGLPARAVSDALQLRVCKPVKLDDVF